MVECESSELVDCSTHYIIAHFGDKFNISPCGAAEQSLSHLNVTGSNPGLVTAAQPLPSC